MFIIHQQCTNAGIMYMYIVHTTFVHLLLCACMYMYMYMCFEVERITENRQVVILNI